VTPLLIVYSAPPQTNERKGLAMAHAPQKDQRTMVEEYLAEISLAAEGWRVVDPAYGDFKDSVWLQKVAPLAADVENARLYLPRRDLEDLPPDQIKKRILGALRKDL